MFCRCIFVMLKQRVFFSKSSIFILSDSLSIKNCSVNNYKLKYQNCQYRKIANKGQMFLWWILSEIMQIIGYPHNYAFGGEKSGCFLNCRGVTPYLFLKILIKKLKLSYPTKEEISRAEVFVVRSNWAA